MSKTSQAFNRTYEEQRQNLIHLLRQVPGFVDMVSKVGEKELRAVLPSDLLRRLNNDSVKFGKSAMGGLSATIHNSQTGVIEGQVSLVEISPEFLSSLNQMAIQHALAEIAQRLESIEKKVDNVLQGQRDDRVGLVDGGENLYALAAAANHSENRRLLLVSAVSQLSEARGRLMQDLETNIKAIEGLPTSGVGIAFMSITRDIPKEVETKADHLENALWNVLRASCILALTCGQLDEPVLLQESWKQLERFIPQLRAAQEKIVSWLPDNPRAFPDKFSTLMSLTDEVIETGRRLEIGNVETPIIEFSLDEVIEGETA